MNAGFSQKKTVAILTSVAIVGGAIATYFTGIIKHYFIYIVILISIMIALSLISVITTKSEIKED